MPVVLNMDGDVENDMMDMEEKKIYSGVEGEKKVLDRLRRLCARREYCVKDIVKKADALFGGDPDAVGRVVDSLVKDRYVDDLRYASAFAREKAQISGWGAVKISTSLRMKGVAPEVISEALESIDEDKAGMKLYKVICIKYRSLSDDPQCKMKLLRFTLGRGYSYEQVMPLIQRCLDEDGK